MAVMHALAVVPEDRQFPGNVCAARFLPHQMAKSVDDLADALGIVAKDVAPFLEPGRAGRVVRTEGGIGRDLKVLGRVPTMPGFRLCRVLSATR